MAEDHGAESAEGDRATRSDEEIQWETLFDTVDILYSYYPAGRQTTQSQRDIALLCGCVRSLFSRVDPVQKPEAKYDRSWWTRDLSSAKSDSCTNLL